MRELFRKDFNFTAFKKWETYEEIQVFRTFIKSQILNFVLAYFEYKESEARKNGAKSDNAGSFDGVTRQRSIGKSINVLLDQ